MGLKSAGEGQIVQVQGGHIIRATGRKDRHSKVFTAKGPRDRRVRLSANTAIQFYDVQDRLGYDRPSKAVDWLIKNAEASIKKLAELPPWDPCAGSSNAVDGNVCSGQISVSDHTGTSYNPPSSNEYVPQGGDSMKSLFPTTTEDNPMNFQSYPHGLISTGCNRSQDLCLSLQSLQDPGTTTHQTHSNHDQTLFQGSESLGFDIGPSGWAEQHHHHHHQDMTRFMRLMGWDGNGGSEGRGGILFNPPPLLPPVPQALLLNQQGSNLTYSQRGALQSSFTPLARTLEDHQHQDQSTISGLGPGSDAFMAFCLPSHIHGDLHGGASISKRASPSSLSPDSSQH